MLHKAVTLPVYDVDKDVDHDNCAGSSDPCTATTVTNTGYDYRQHKGEIAWFQVNMLSN